MKSRFVKGIGKRVGGDGARVPFGLFVQLDESSA